MMTIDERHRRWTGAVARIRWHYTDLGFMKAFAALLEADRKDYPGAPLRRQAKKLMRSARHAEDAHEIQFDEHGCPLYFLRRVLDGDSAWSEDLRFRVLRGREGPRHGSVVLLLAWHRSPGNSADARSSRRSNLRKAAHIGSRPSSSLLT